MKTRILSSCIVVLILFILVPNVFAEEEILIVVENEVRKVYYAGENIISVLADPESASVIFETGKNAKLDIKAPKVYKVGPDLFILRNGEEVDAVTDSDECFFYATIETQEPEKIEIIFAFWPEYPETVENCETFEEESTLSHDPYTDDERLQLASEKKFVSEETMGGGSGIGFFDKSDFNLSTIIIAIPIGVGSALVLTYYLRKRK